jgi:hypothetical protein
VTVVGSTLTTKTCIMTADSDDLLYHIGSIFELDRSPNKSNIRGSYAGKCSLLSQYPWPTRATATSIGYLGDLDASRAAS